MQQLASSNWGAPGNDLESFGGVREQKGGILQAFGRHSSARFRPVSSVKPSAGTGFQCQASVSESVALRFSVLSGVSESVALRCPVSTLQADLEHLTSVPVALCACWACECCARPNAPRIVLWTLTNVEDHLLARGTAHVVRLHKEQGVVCRREHDPVRSETRKTRGQQRPVQRRCGQCGVHECVRPWGGSSRSAHPLGRRGGGGRG